MTPRYYFDCETDGLLESVTVLHSLVIKQVDGAEYFSCTPHNYISNDPFVHTYMSVEQALEALMGADEIIGHNIIKYDIPALQKLYPWFQPKGKITDTLVISRFHCPALVDFDMTQVRRGKFPSKLVGSHSLKAWGYRLGVLKGEFGDTDDWSEWSHEMQTYCEQDVTVTEALYLRLTRNGLPEKALWVEHEFAKIIGMQERNGFAFDEEAAYRLYRTLVSRRLELAQELTTAFPPVEKTEVFTPKVNNKAKGYIKGQPYIKRWEVEFNPSSRQMIAERLKALGWEPSEFTPSGQAKVDETTLSALPYPEAKLLAEHFLVEKRIGQLAEGDQAWLKLVRKGRIHGSVNTNGAVTGRCTHSNPNVAQVPKVGSPYGAESRSLFTASRNRKLVGVDLSGLELRCLAHFMSYYDDGAYGKVILEGDVHSVNQQAAGLPTRDNAKTFIYAFLYGAGDEKIGSIVEPDSTPARQKQIGKALKKKFLKQTPALKSLRDMVIARAEANGYLIGLDGRRLHVRSSHSALNTLLQSAGALISKVATILAYEKLSTCGYVFGKDYAFVAHIHDEIQCECLPSIAEEVGQTIVEAMRDTGKFFEFRCPIDGEYKIGSNWMETH